MDVDFYQTFIDAIILESIDYKSYYRSGTIRSLQPFNCELLTTMPLGISLASRVLASKTLTSWVTPVATWYANLAGYRKYGLKYDDLRMLLIPLFLQIPILSLLYSYRGE